MTALNLSLTDVGIAAGVLVVLATVWRSGARRGRAAERAMRGGARLVSLAGRVLFTAGLIVAAQWGVIAAVPSRWALLAVLGVPALFSAYTLTRALTVTALDFAPPHQRPVRRRHGGGGR